MPLGVTGQAAGPTELTSAWPCPALGLWPLPLHLSLSLVPMATSPGLQRAGSELAMVAVRKPKFLGPQSRSSRQSRTKADTGCDGGDPGFYPAGSGAQGCAGKQSLKRNSPTGVLIHSTCRFLRCKYSPTGRDERWRVLSYQRFNRRLVKFLGMHPWASGPGAVVSSSLHCPHVTSLRGTAAIRRREQEAPQACTALLDPTSAEPREVGGQDPFQGFSSSPWGSWPVVCLVRFASRGPLVQTPS